MRLDAIEEHNITFTKPEGKFALVKRSVVEYISVTDQVEFKIKYFFSFWNE
jgi:hypothetical protein